MTPKRILVIDDEPGVRDIVRIALEMSGHEVIEATSGEAGLKEANRHTPDLILCDVDMPGLDGRKTLRAVRLSQKLNSVPVVFVSGLPDEVGPRKSIAAKVEGYLVKPFKLEELMEVVQRCLNQAPNRDRD